MTGTHDDAVQDGKVGLLVPALEVTQAISQVAAYPGLNNGGRGIIAVGVGVIYSSCYC